MKSRLSKDIMEAMKIRGQDGCDDLELSENGVDNIDRKISGRARGSDARNQITRSQIGSVLAKNAEKKMAVIPKGEEEVDDDGDLKKVNDIVRRNKINQHAKGIEDMLAGKEMFVNGKKYDNTKIMSEAYIKQLRIILENEVEQAGVLMAAKGFSQDIQTMIEKMGRLMNEELGPVVDNMRMAYGAQQAEAFAQAMRQDMQSIMDNMLTVKDNIDDAVDELAAGQIPNMDNDMDAGSDADINAGDNVDLDLPDEIGSDFGDVQPDDAFGGDESASGPMEDPLGRPQKESVQNLHKQLVEMKKRINKLKKLKESKKAK